MSTRVSVLRLAVPFVVALALASSCSSDNDPTVTPSTNRTTTCRGGDVRLLQGQPADLPGGGTAGIGQVFADRDPLQFDLAVGAGSYGPRATEPLVVGDEFTVEGTTYRVGCISRSVVTLAETG